MTLPIDDYKQEAVRLFDEEILKRWKIADNVWRNAWAMDTLLDYFPVCGVDASPYADVALNCLNPTKKGNWWDDFGWIGIASLRAAELNLWPKYQDQFVKIAINSWAYMFGPGWSTSNTAIYPFTSPDLPGWKDFETGHQSNFGAPNVWNNIQKTWQGITEEERMQRKARYSPGGIWNSPITDDILPELVLQYVGTRGYVNPIQNTVTNAVFTILSLRIVQAGGRFPDVFRQSQMDAFGCLRGWKDQITWFNQWILQTTAADESMKLGTDTWTLIRERVSTFDEYEGQRNWDAAYDTQWAWTGDQGLMLGALREGRASGKMSSPVFDLYPQIAEGVFKNGYFPRTYNGIQGNFLLPWIVVGSDHPYTETAQGSDDGDYQTGTAVFMRYLLQAYKTDPGLVRKYKTTILDSANNIIKKGFGPIVTPTGSCDSFTPYTGADSVTQMTPYINRLSVLLLAIELSK